VPPLRGATRTRSHRTVVPHLPPRLARRTPKPAMPLPGRGHRTHPAHPRSSPLPHPHAPAHRHRRTRHGHPRPAPALTPPTRRTARQPRSLHTRKRTAAPSSTSPADPRRHAHKTPSQRSQSRSPRPPCRPPDGGRRRRTGRHRAVIPRPASALPEWPRRPPQRVRRQRGLGALPCPRPGRRPCADSAPKCPADHPPLHAPSASNKGLVLATCQPRHRSHRRAGPADPCPFTRCGGAVKLSAAALGPRRPAQARLRRIRRSGLGKAADLRGARPPRTRGRRSRRHLDRAPVRRGHQT
jgi:hypothetical protein